MKASDLIRTQNSDAKEVRINKDKTDSSKLDDIWDSAIDTHTPQDAEREPLGDLEGFEDGDCDDNQGCSFLEEEEFGVEEYSEGEIEMHEDAQIDDGVKEEDTAKESNKRSKLTKDEESRDLQSLHSSGKEERGGFSKIYRTEKYSVASTSKDVVKELPDKVDCELVLSEDEKRRSGESSSVCDKDHQSEMESKEHLSSSSNTASVPPCDASMENDSSIEEVGNALLV